MEYQLLGKSWQRYALFRHFCDEVPCAITMQGRVEVTALREAAQDTLPFTAAVLYCAAYIMNNRDEFRLTATRDGEPALWNEIHPAYTVFHEEDASYTAAFTRYTPDLHLFADRFVEDTARARSIRTAIPAPPNTFTASVLPWYAYDAVTLQYGPGAEIPLSPMLILGRYQTADGRTLLPVTLSIHHAAADGFHVCRFFRELETLTAAVARRI